MLGSVDGISKSFGNRVNGEMQGMLSAEWERGRIRFQEACDGNRFSGRDLMLAAMGDGIDGIDGGGRNSVEFQELKNCRREKWGRADGVGEVMDAGE